MFAEKGVRLPVMISFTITDKSGRTLSGQTLEAFYISIRHAHPFSIGINCALGARDMRPYLADLARIADCYVSSYPNAGLPNAFGQYDELPDETARLRPRFRHQRLREHRRRLLRHDAGSHRRDRGGGAGRRAPRLRYTVRADAESAIDDSRIPHTAPRIDRLYAALRPRAARHPSRQQLPDDRRADERHRLAAVRAADQGGQLRRGDARRARPGARRRQHHRRQHGRRHARLRAGDDDVPELHRDRARDRARAGDDRQLEVDGARGGPEVRPGQGRRQLDQPEGRRGRLPREGARWSTTTAPRGRDGLRRDRARRTRSSARSQICQRAYKLLDREAGFDPSDIIFDPNILAIATGLEEHNDYAVNYIEATRIIKATCPGVKISGGVSNLSFSFRGNDVVREAMHSAFLFHAIKAGMDMGIVNAGQLVVYEDIPKDLLEHVEDVIFNRRPDATERLVQFAETVKGAGKKREEDVAWRERRPSRSGCARARARHRRVHRAGHRGGAAEVPAAARHHRRAADGRHEDRRRPVRLRQDVPAAGREERPRDEEGGGLPRAVHGRRTRPTARRRIRRPAARRAASSMATVKGDVHDIGKNIVGVVLGCNNYEVIDLGVMVPAAKILDTAIERHADMIGLSGLITPSLDEMVMVAREMERRKMTHAAADRRRDHEPPAYGGQDRAGVCPGRSSTCSTPRASWTSWPAWSTPSAATPSIAATATPRKRFASATRRESEKPLLSYEQARANRLQYDWDDHVTATPAFVGRRYLDDVPLARLAKYIDWTYFFSAWELKGRYPGDPGAPAVRRGGAGAVRATRRSC